MIQVVPQGAVRIQVVPIALNALAVHLATLALLTMGIARQLMTVVSA